MKTVVVFGVFDLLHLGHIAFLDAARKKGDRLVVVLSADVRVRAEKGQAPFFSWSERAAMLRALSCVDKVVAGDSGRRWSVVRRLAPDVICVGFDQRADHPAFLAQLAGLRRRPQIVKLRPFRRSRYASSVIKIEIHRRQAAKKRKLA